MSQEIVGADLAQLEELSISFQTAGTEIAAKASALDTRIQAAIAAFETTLGSLQTEAADLGTTIVDEMHGLSTESSGVQWTGANRTAFDSDLGTFSTTVNNGVTQIDADITSIKTQVDTSFNPVLTDFGVALKQTGTDVDTSTGDMQTAVTNQRNNLDQAANVGWAYA